MRIDPYYFLAVPAEPGERGLIAARQTLARLLGRPEPDDYGHYATLVDQYHDLTVGPVPAEEFADWEDIPWVDVWWGPEPGWGCDYKRWVSEFGRSLPADPFELHPATTGVEYELPQEIEVERFGESWVVRDEDGSYWCGLIDDLWADAPDDPITPALSFPTEAEARAAYAQANQMYDERTARHAEAIKRLGRSERD
jgi:hypothetical protein